MGVTIVLMSSSLPLPSSVKVNFDAKQHAELILKMHVLTKENIERMNAKYKLA